MFEGQKSLAISFYDHAMFEYVEACDQAVELYAEHKLPEREELIRAETRMRSTYEKLKTVVKIANYKFGTSFAIPHLVFDKAWCKRLQ
jgi:hypothetical protein